MPKITEEQKKSFYNHYKQGLRALLISRETGISHSYVKRVLHDFGVGDYSWMESDFRHQNKAIAENDRQGSSSWKKRRNHCRKGLLSTGRTSASARKARRILKKKTLRTISECRRLGIPLRRCLEELGLSSSTYHFWKKHENEENQKDKRLSEAIRCIQEQNHWVYGSKRMAKWLVSEGFADRLNHKRVERVMEKFDLHAKIRRRRYPKNYYTLP